MTPIPDDDDDDDDGDDGDDDDDDNDDDDQYDDSPDHCHTGRGWHPYDHPWHIKYAKRLLCMKLTRHVYEVDRRSQSHPNSVVSTQM